LRELQIPVDYFYSATFTVRAIQKRFGIFHPLCGERALEVYPPSFSHASGTAGLRPDPRRTTACASAHVTEPTHVLERASLGQGSGPPDVASSRTRILPANRMEPCAALQERSSVHRSGVERSMEACGWSLKTSMNRCSGSLLTRDSGLF
jgi:hypothetical protein